jgi:glyoxylase-like metal-dependent hydrolase (beta-lactamase superfamily II)
MKMISTQTTSMSREELQDILARHEQVAIVDVRPLAQREEWHIPGSRHVDVYDALRAGDQHALDAFDLDPAVPVVTICAVGKMSRIAAEQLRSRGFDARSLTGGMKAWSMAWNTAEITVPESSAAIVQIRRTGKGCLSYLIGSGTEAIVIDASLDPATYLILAAHRGWTITHVFDTHVHADHISRSRDLATSAGATLHLPDTDRATYPFAPIREGDTITFGSSNFNVLATPGHTSESMTYRLDDGAVFTGDTLFLAGVGRPDLEADADAARNRARLLWRSLRRLTRLPGETLVLPGHTSQPVPFDESPITAPMSAVREQTPALTLNETQFVETILSRLPPTPPNHAAIVSLNETGAMPDGDPTDLEAGANRCAIS